MIYTVTFNPSLDYIVGVENFRAGEINRTSSEKLLPSFVSIVSLPAVFMAGSLSHSALSVWLNLSASAGVSRRFYRAGDREQDAGVWLHDRFYPC